MQGLLLNDFYSIWKLSSGQAYNKILRVVNFALVSKVLVQFKANVSNVFAMTKIYDARLSNLHLTFWFLQNLYCLAEVNFIEARTLYIKHEKIQKLFHNLFVPVLRKLAPEPLSAFQEIVVDQQVLTGSNKRFKPFLWVRMAFILDGLYYRENFLFNRVFLLQVLKTPFRVDRTFAELGALCINLLKSVLKKLRWDFSFLVVEVIFFVHDLLKLAWLGKKTFEHENNLPLFKNAAFMPIVAVKPGLPVCLGRFVLRPFLFQFVDHFFEKVVNTILSFGGKCDCTH